jgi:hypothetical protein
MRVARARVTCPRLQVLSPRVSRPTAFATASTRHAQRAPLSILQRRSLRASASGGGGSLQRRARKPRKPSLAMEDPSSYATPSLLRVTHVDLELAVDFDAQRVNGYATVRLMGET